MSHVISLPSLATDAEPDVLPVRPLALTSTIVGLGSFLPGAVLSNADLERLVDTSDSWILERTGIKERRRAGVGETASVMASAAAREALTNAGHPTIDVIMVATCTPDTLIPPTACLVQRRLGLAGVPAFDINVACSGFVYGMTVADALIRGGQAQNILLIAAESMTTLVDYHDRTTCVLFGDGAGAVVMGPSEGSGVQATSWGADGREADIIHVAPTDDSAAVLHMAGKGTFRNAVEHLCDVSEEVCDKAGWALSEVDLLVPHQANLRIVEAAAKRLGFPMSKVVFNGDVVGNTSSASVPLALCHAAKTDMLHQGDRVLCVAFGAGATWGGVALEWTLS